MAGEHDRCLTVHLPEAVRVDHVLEVTAVHGDGLHQMPVSGAQFAVHEHGVIALDGLLPRFGHRQANLGSGFEPAIPHVFAIGDGKQGVIRLYLKYTDSKRPVISGIKRISKPGLRVYASKDELPKVLGGLGVAIISTSSGIMTDKKARKLGIGGEVMAYIW